MLIIDIKKEFSQDWISREAGEKLRNRILQANQKGEAIIIDFGDKMIASTSFFDEGFAKLSEGEWTLEKLFSKIELRNLHPRDKQVLLALCQNRGMK